MTAPTKLPRRDRDRLIFRIATPLGLLLFVAWQLGARTNAFALPFDPHHILTQLLGGAVLLYGLMHWK